MKYERIIRSMCRDCYAILPEKLEQIVGVIEARMMGITVDASALEIEAGRRKPIRSGRLGIIPIMGVISHHASAISASLGASTEGIGAEFDSMMDSPEIGGIILRIDSPGGSVSGVEELASKIFNRRGEKPVVAVSDSVMASAAFHIGTAADEVIVTPSGMVGSVGVVAMHVDQSVANEQAGLKPTYIHAGKHKIEGHSHAPLEDEAHAEIQSQVDRYYGMFIDALAKQRDTTTTRVERDFGQGRMLSPAAAKEANMIDRIATFEQVVAEMSGKVQPKRRSTAAARRRLAISPCHRATSTGHPAT